MTTLAALLLLVFGGTVDAPLVASGYIRESGDVCVSLPVAGQTQTGPCRAYLLFDVPELAAQPQLVELEVTQEQQFGTSGGEVITFHLVDSFSYSGLKGSYAGWSGVLPQDEHITANLPPDQYPIDGGPWWIGVDLATYSGGADEDAQGREAVRMGTVQTPAVGRLVITP